MSEHQGGGKGPIDRAKEDFFPEAQELVDGLGRDLLAIDENLKIGHTDPELINDVFRAVHTLKGLSGLFGAALMSGLSHELENVLDEARLGRLELSTEVLDLVFRAVDLYTRLLAFERGDAPEPSVEVRTLLGALGALTQRGAAISANPVVQYELDPGLLGVLTEYEEHRLRTNIQSGFRLYKLRVRFSLATIDTALDELKAKTRSHGEIITYLPTGDASDGDSLELEILIASRETIAILRAAIETPDLHIEEVSRRANRPSAPIPPPIPPSRALPSEFPSIVAPDFEPEPRTSMAHVRAPSIPPGQSMVPPAAERDVSLRSVSQTVRVDIRKLDHLMNIVGELAIVRTGLFEIIEKVRMRSGMRELAAELQRLHRTFERHLGQMQSGILEVRMVPLGQAFDKLARIVRQISREHDKQVNLVITGAETEIDKLIVEELSDPLMHMIRNAIDHAIEPREDRVRVGKPPVGTIAVNAFQKGNQVVIEVEDDGRGMDPDRIAFAAMRLGMLTPDEAKELPQKEILNLVFKPGFTTREVATDTSGRGVGMDVVKTNIGKLGGIVDISSEIGIGTKMTITLPITLAIISVLMVEVGGRTYAVPLTSIEEAIAFDESLVRAFEGREVMTQRGATLPVCRLRKHFGHEVAVSTRSGPRRSGFVVIASVGERRLGFVVDRLLGQQDIVIKALGKSLSKVRGFAGATELGDQRVALVLDVASLIEDVLSNSLDARSHLQGSLS